MIEFEKSQGKNFTAKDAESAMFFSYNSFLCVFRVLCSEFIQSEAVQSSIFKRAYLAIWRWILKLL